MRLGNTTKRWYNFYFPFFLGYILYFVTLLNNFLIFGSVLMLPSYTVKLHIPNTYKNVRGFRRSKNSFERPESPFTKLNTENKPLQFSKLLKPFVFTITVCTMMIIFVK